MRTRPLAPTTPQPPPAMTHAATRLGTTAAIVALSAFVPTLAAQAQDDAGNVSHHGDAIPWEDSGPGVRFVALYGDMSTQGEPFVFRLEVQAGFELRPHTHPITEHLTVLSGRFYIGLGETMDRENAVAYEPGSYVAIAADVPAYMWAEEETVIQVHGVGPLATEFIEPSGG